ncbi:MAG: hypothetical protein U0798_12740 [Gemmataceae bacterium]
MHDQPQIRVALQKEAVRIKSALDDFADLAMPRKKRNATVEPPAMSTNSDLFSLDSVHAASSHAGSSHAAPVLPESSHSESSEVNFFSDFDPDGSNWSEESQSFAESRNDFNPGVGEDFFDGFESEVDVPGKTGQDTLSMPVATTNQDTPANGTPKPTEAINDILDAFEW